MVEVVRELNVISTIWLRNVYIYKEWVGWDWAEQYFNEEPPLHFWVADCIKSRHYVDRSHPLYNENVSEKNDPIEANGWNCGYNQQLPSAIILNFLISPFCPWNLILHYPTENTNKSKDHRNSLDYSKLMIDSCAFSNVFSPSLVFLIFWSFIPLGKLFIFNLHINFCLEMIISL